MTKNNQKAYTLVMLMHQAQQLIPHCNIIMSQNATRAILLMLCIHCLRHTQMVHTKLYIPLMCGGKPPNLQQLFQKISNKKPLFAGEKHKLNVDIKYYMTLLSPWTLQQSTTQHAPKELLSKHSITYLDFCKFVEELDLKFTTNKQTPIV